MNISTRGTTRLAHRLRAWGLGILAGLPLAADAQDELTEVTLLTSWFAQAEHGGFYQAKATGLYEEYGLDVTIKMGGPQVNGLQLLVADRADFVMGYPIRNLTAVERGVPVITVAAAFQFSPQGFIAHPEVETIEQVTERTLLVANSATETYWPWFKQRFDVTDAQKEPYTFNIAPFLNDKDLVQQAYVTSEPYAAQQGGLDPTIFLFADYGYPPYAQTIETRIEMVEDNPEVVRAFVEASMKGWADYFKDPAPANELIQADNPEMSDEQIAFSIDKIQEYELVTGGDAAEKGIGAMTRERWKEIYDFMVQADLLDPSVDYTQAYTLDFLPQPAVTP